MGKLIYMVLWFRIGYAKLVCTTYVSNNDNMAIIINNDKPEEYATVFMLVYCDFNCNEAGHSMLDIFKRFSLRYN